MAASKREKPAARNAVKDEEVKTAEHDALLHWLIENVSDVVADRWGLAEGEVSEKLAVAKKTAKEWVEGSVLETLQGYAEGTLKREPDLWRVGRKKGEDDGTLSEPTRRAAAMAVQRVPAVAKAIASLPDDAKLGDALLKRYEVMKFVYQREPRADGTHKEIGAGYVDLAASVLIPADLRIVVKGISREARERYEWYRSRLDAWDDNELKQQIDAMTPKNVEIEKRGNVQDIWFSVRSGSFTLGEVLQELKGLQRLDDGEHSVALVVDLINAQMLERIEHEGFTVIVRSDY
jgi:hypothetical protein